MAKKKFYVVWQGRHPGIYASWEACKKEIDGCKGAKYKGFPDRTSAETAFREGPDKYWGKDVAPVIDLSAAKEQPVSQEPVKPQYTQEEQETRKRRLVLKTTIAVIAAGCVVIFGAIAYYIYELL